MISIWANFNAQSFIHPKLSMQSSELFLYVSTCLQQQCGVLFIGKKIHSIFIPFRLIFKLIYKEAFPKKKTKAQNNHHQHSTSSATAE